MLKMLTINLNINNIKSQIFDLFLGLCFLCPFVMRMQFFSSSPISFSLPLFLLPLARYFHISTLPHFILWLSPFWCLRSKFTNEQLHRTTLGAPSKITLPFNMLLRAFFFFFFSDNPFFTLLQLDNHHCFLKSQESC